MWADSLLGKLSAELKTFINFFLLKLFFAKSRSQNSLIRLLARTESGEWMF